MFSVISAVNLFQYTSAGEIHVDSCGRTGLGETPQRRRSEEALQPPTESEVYFPRGCVAQPKIISYRTVSINYASELNKNKNFKTNLKLYIKLSFENGQALRYY
jgi:hypothetical protein